MIEQDTIKLLRECDAGIRMGTDAIADVLDHVKNKKLRQILGESKGKHEALQEELLVLLHNCHDDGKTPNPIVKGMSHFKTSVKLAAENSDQTVADLMTDGCNMGVKSIHRYLNQYANADNSSKKIAEKLSDLEEALCKDMRCYL